MLKKSTQMQSDRDKSDRRSDKRRAELTVCILNKRRDGVIHIFTDPFSVCSNGDRGRVRNTEEVYCGEIVSEYEVKLSSCFGGSGNHHLYGMNQDEVETTLIPRDTFSGQDNIALRTTGDGNCIVANLPQ